MEQLDYLWDFQELDIKMDEIIAQKKNSTLRRELQKTIRYLKNQQQNIIKLNNDIDKENHIYNRIFHEFENANKVLEEEGGLLDREDATSLKSLDQIEKKILETEEKLQESKKELAQLLKDMDSLNKRLQGVTSRLRKGKKDYDKVKKEYDISMKDIDAKHDALKSERDIIKKKIDSTLLKRYETKKNSHSVVMAEIKQDRCGGCNMSLASLVVQNVKSKTRIIECENCGRILYTRTVS